MAPLHHAPMTYTTAKTQPNNQPNSQPLVHTRVTKGAIPELIREWTLLSQSPEVLRKVNAWKLPGEPVTDLDDVLRRAGFGCAADDQEADHYLWLLVCIAATDTLAARIVLQRIMPPILAVARRRGRITAGGVNVALSEIIGTSWDVIRTFPCERRKCKIASNLVRDSEYHAFVRHQRLRHVTESLIGHEMLSDVIAIANENTGESELTELIHHALQAGYDPDHARLLLRLADGQDIEAIASSLGVSSRTIRTRRTKAVADLRRVRQLLL